MNRGIFLEGDSLAEGVHPYLKKLVPTDWNFYGDHEVGRGTAVGVERLKKSIALSYDVWVVILGTNDWPTNYGYFAYHVDEVHYMAGPRRVVWPTIHRPPELSNGLTMDRYNQVLRWEEAKSASFAAPRWNKAVTDNPEWVAQDPQHVHPNGTGYYVMAEMIWNAIAGGE